MRLNRVNSAIDRTERNKLNENFDIIERGQSSIQNQINQLVIEGDSSVEAAQARVSSDDTVYDTLKARLDAENAQVSQQLKETRKQSFINVRDFGAKGDFDISTNIGTDDTAAFMAAKNQAESLKKKVYIPSGTYLIKEPYVMSDLSNNGFFGDGKQQTILVFDLQEGETAIEVNTHYFRQSEIRDLRVQNRNKNLTINGIRIAPPTNGTWTWGSSCNLKNVDISEFTGTFLELVESFNTVHEACRLVGVYDTENESNRIGTALKISSSNSYSNVNSFINCVFNIAKIGIQNLNGTNFEFISCTFENLTLFHNIVANNRVTPFEIFENCWFEKISNGIVNAKIDEITLMPITPIEGNVSIDNIVMVNNYLSGNVASTFLNQTINPDTIFSPINGLVYGKKVLFRSATLLNGWTGSFNYQKNDKGIVMIQVYIKPTTTVPVGSGTSAVGKIANIEAGFRPNSSCIIPVRDASGNIKHIFINNNGDVIVGNESVFNNTDNHTGQATYYGAN